MTDLVACAPYQRVNVVVDGHADIANAFITSGNYYRMLGLTANPGRTIVPDDDRPDAAPVAVISPALLADEVRGGSRGDWQGGSHQQRSGHHRRRHLAAVRGHPDGSRRAARHRVTLAMEARLNTAGPPPGQANIPRSTTPPTGGCKWWVA
jgi:hypothetical protein